MLSFKEIYNETVDTSKFPPLHPGDRLVYLVHPDGKKEIVAFSDKFYTFKDKKWPSIARPLNGAWSHGTAKDGSKIEEIL